MAALVVNQDFDLANLHQELAAKLPAYARPVFLRVLNALEITGTFKLRKQELVNEGYDPTRVRDPLFLDSAAAGGYVPLDAPLFARLQSGTLRL
jgi:fatty-acyl-CoA synthase